MVRITTSGHRRRLGTGGALLLLDAAGEVGLGPAGPPPERRPMGAGRQRRGAAEPAETGRPVAKRARKGARAGGRRQAG